MRQVHQDEEANVEMSNFELLDMPLSQTGLNVSGVQVQKLHLTYHDHGEINFMVIIVKQHQHRWLNEPKVDLQYYVGAISGQHSGAYVFRWFFPNVYLGDSFTFHI